MKRVVVLAALFTTALGVAPAVASTRPSDGTDQLCPATKPLTESQYKQEASLIRAYLGCRVSDDPGPNNPGGKY
jgi:hypothetical protein